MLIKLSILSKTNLTTSKKLLWAGVAAGSIAGAAVVIAPYVVGDADEAQPLKVPKQVLDGGRAVWEHVQNSAPQQLGATVGQLVEGKYLELEAALYGAMAGWLSHVCELPEGRQFVLDVGGPGLLTTLIDWSCDDPSSKQAAAEAAVVRLIQSGKDASVALSQPGALARLLLHCTSGKASEELQAALEKLPELPDFTPVAHVQDVQVMLQLLRGRHGGSIQQLAARFLSAWAATSAANRRKLTAGGVHQALAEVATAAASGRGGDDARRLLTEVMRVMAVMAHSSGVGHVDQVQHMQHWVEPILYMAADAMVAFQDVDLAHLALSLMATCIQRGGGEVRQALLSSNILPLLQIVSAGPEQLLWEDAATLVGLLARHGMLPQHEVEQWLLKLLAWLAAADAGPGLKQAATNGMAGLAGMQGHTGLKVAHYWLGDLLDLLAAQAEQQAAAAATASSTTAARTSTSLTRVPVTYVRWVSSELRAASDAVGGEHDLPPNMAGLLDPAALAMYPATAQAVDAALADAKVCTALEVLCTLVAEDPTRQTWLQDMGVLPLLHRLVVQRHRPVHSSSHPAPPRPPQPRTTTQESAAKPHVVIPQSQESTSPIHAMSFSLAMASAPSHAAAFAPNNPAAHVATCGIVTPANQTPGSHVTREMKAQPVQARQVQHGQQPQQAQQPWQARPVQEPQQVEQSKHAQQLWQPQQAHKLQGQQPAQQTQHEQGLHVPQAHSMQESRQATQLLHLQLLQHLQSIHPAQQGMHLQQADQQAQHVLQQHQPVPSSVPPVSTSLHTQHSAGTQHSQQCVAAQHDPRNCSAQHTQRLLLHSQVDSTRLNSSLADQPWGIHAPSSKSCVACRCSGSSANYRQHLQSMHPGSPSQQPPISPHGSHTASASVLARPPSLKQQDQQQQDQRSIPSQRTSVHTRLPDTRSISLQQAPVYLDQQQQSCAQIHPTEHHPLLGVRLTPLSHAVLPYRALADGPTLDTSQRAPYHNPHKVHEPSHTAPLPQSNTAPHSYLNPSPKRLRSLPNEAQDTTSQCPSHNTSHCMPKDTTHVTLQHESHNMPDSTTPSTPHYVTHNAPYSTAHGTPHDTVQGTLHSTQDNNSPYSLHTGGNMPGNVSQPTSRTHAVAGAAQTDASSAASQPTQLRGSNCGSIPASRSCPPSSSSNYISSLVHSARSEIILANTSNFGQAFIHADHLESMPTHTSCHDDVSAVSSNREPMPIAASSTQGMQVHAISPPGLHEQAKGYGFLSATTTNGSLPLGSHSSHNAPPAATSSRAPIKSSSWSLLADKQQQRLGHPNLLPAFQHFTCSSTSPAANPPCVSRVSSSMAALTLLPVQHPSVYQLQETRAGPAPLSGLLPAGHAETPYVSISNFHKIGEPSIDSCSSKQGDRTFNRGSPSSKGPTTTHASSQYSPVIADIAGNAGVISPGQPTPHPHIMQASADPTGTSSAFTLSHTSTLDARASSPLTTALPSPKRSFWRPFWSSKSAQVPAPTETTSQTQLRSHPATEPLSHPSQQPPPDQPAPLLWPWLSSQPPPPPNEPSLQPPLIPPVQPPSGHPSRPLRPAPSSQQLSPPSQPVLQPPPHPAVQQPPPSQSAQQPPAKAGQPSSGWFNFWPWRKSTPTTSSSHTPSNGRDNVNSSGAGAASPSGELGGGADSQWPTVADGTQSLIPDDDSGGWDEPTVPLCLQRETARILAMLTVHKVGYDTLAGSNWLEWLWEASGSSDCQLSSNAARALLHLQATRPDAPLPPCTPASCNALCHPVFLDGVHLLNPADLQHWYLAQQPDRRLEAALNSTLRSLVDAFVDVMDFSHETSHTAAPASELIEGSNEVSPLKPAPQIDASAVPSPDVHTATSLSRSSQQPAQPATLTGTPQDANRTTSIANPLHHQAQAAGIVPGTNEHSPPPTYLSSSRHPSSSSSGSQAQLQPSPPASSSLSSDHQQTQASAPTSSPLPADTLHAPAQAAPKAQSWYSYFWGRSSSSPPAAERSNPGKIEDTESGAAGPGLQDQPAANVAELRGSNKRDDEANQRLSSQGGHNGPIASSNGASSNGTSAASVPSLGGRPGSDAGLVSGSQHGSKLGSGLGSTAGSRPDPTPLRLGSVWDVDDLDYPDGTRRVQPAAAATDITAGAVAAVVRQGEIASALQGAADSMAPESEARSHHNTELNGDSGLEQDGAVALTDGWVAARKRERHEGRTGGVNASSRDVSARDSDLGECDAGGRSALVGPPLVDVVFIHGMRGGAFMTWRREKAGRSNMTWEDCWVSAWLVWDLPNARMLTLGYPAPATTWEVESAPLVDTSIRLLQKLAAAGVGQRPIVFVVHSMGGLIVKEMLVRVFNQGPSSPYYNMLQQTRGVVFYATPHFGSSIAALGWKLGVKPAPSVEHLVPGPHLTELNAAMRRLHSAGQLRVLNFVEGQATYVARVFPKIHIVPVQTGYPGFGELAVLQGQDHIDVCKPLTKDAPGYAQLLKFVRRIMVEVAAEEVARQRQEDVEFASATG